MLENKLNLHPLLLKQLARSRIDLEVLLANPEMDWLNFINRVSRTYTDHEQECYLLERSLEISSREMSMINEKLENAQELARLGYWQYEKNTDQFIWSKTMFSLTGIAPFEEMPKLDEFSSHIHEEFRAQFLDLLTEVFDKKIPRQIELKFKNKVENKYLWFLIKIYPIIKGESPAECHEVSGIVLDISQQKEYEINIKKAHQKLMDLSRQVGMAEVATSVLHNVGNIMNSTNISLGIIESIFKKDYPHKLVMIAQMIKENHDHLADYLSQDPKGKLIPQYIIELAEIAAKEHQIKLKELKNIEESLCHINEMISTQNFYTRPLGITEKVSIKEEVEKALQLAVGTGKTKVSLKKEYAKTPLISADRSKLLQILVNLIRNAYEAVSHNINSKDVLISVKNNNKSIQVLVSDNGIGIDPRNMNRMFTFGFTTKEKGHGFGLHSSAIAAKELNGTLKAKSAGAGKGTTFILTLPIDKYKLKHRGAGNE